MYLLQRAAMNRTLTLDVLPPLGLIHLIAELQ